MAIATKEERSENLANKPKCFAIFSSKSACYVVVILAVVHFVFILTWYQHPEIFGDNFSFLANNKTLELSPTIKGKVFLVILINTIPKNVERRKTLRETWVGTAGSGGPRSQNIDPKFHKDLGIYCVFMVAFSEVISENKQVFYESSKHGDILRIKTEESYRNMITKVWAGYEWAFKQNPRFLMKTDDDIYVDLPHLLHWLHDKSLPSKLYAGWVLHRGRIMRSQGNNWYVSHAEFMERYFPDYCIGPFYIISGNILGRILTNKNKVKMFNVEDAYLGVLMRFLHISPLNVANLFVWDPRLPNMLPKWSNVKYSEVICLGERLTSKMLRYIHLKYQTIHKTAQYKYMYSGALIRKAVYSKTLIAVAVTWFVNGCSL